MKRFVQMYGALAVLLLIFTTLGLLRLNDLSLYTDSTRYVIWGNSIAHGKGWVDDTQPVTEYYVVNAPFFPLLLSPIFVAFPSSLIAAKVWTLLWAVLALALFYRWMMKYFSPPTALAGVILFAMNPMTLVISTEVLSEAPFLALFMAILLLLERLAKDEPDRKSLLACALLLATVVLLREVAISLALAVALSFAIRKKYTRSVIALGIPLLFFGLWLIRNLVFVGTPTTSQSTNFRFIFEHVVTPPDAPLALEFISRFWLNLKGFGFQLAGMLFYSVPTTLVPIPTELFRVTVNTVGDLKLIVFLFAAPAMLGGLILDVHRSSSGIARFLFLLFYLGIVLIYPIHDVRFLLPVLPLMIFYGFLGTQWAIRRLPIGRWGRPVWAAPALTSVLMIPNFICMENILSTNCSYMRDPIGFHQQTFQTNGTRTYYSTPWMVLGEWVRSHVPENAVIACSAKEIVPFISPRKVLEINDGVPLTLFETMIRDNAAEYLIAVGKWDNITSYEFAMAESRRFRFERIGTTGILHVFRIHSRWMTPRAERTGWTFQYDTTSASGFLRKGRWELLNNRFVQAESSFATATRIFPNQSTILYQQLLLNSFRGDSTGSVRTLERMFNTSAATTYLWAARTHVDAMNSLRSAQKILSPPLRAVRLFEIAQLYWNLGYPFQSYALMRKVVQIDSSYFVGLLWAWHYAIQVGDTAGAGPVLKKLEAIDRGNQVVRQFRSVTDYSDRLRREGDPAARMRLRWDIAHAYEIVDLPEESLDELERAISERPRDPEAWGMYAAYFERLKRPAAARAAREHQQTLTD
jgi:tetratricopeptide (TPR) repeat protein